MKAVLLSILSFSFIASAAPQRQSDISYETRILQMNKRFDHLSTASQKKAEKKVIFLKALEKLYDKNPTL